jgi:hypothetical protein
VRGFVSARDGSGRRRDRLHQAQLATRRWPGVQTWCASGQQMFWKAVVVDGLTLRCAVLCCAVLCELCELCELCRAAQSEGCLGGEDVARVAATFPVNEWEGRRSGAVLFLHGRRKLTWLAVPNRPSWAAGRATDGDEGGGEVVEGGQQCQRTAGPATVRGRRGRGRVAMEPEPCWAR